MLDELRQSLADAFATLAERYGVPAERRHFIMGPPIRTLAEFAAREGLDVLVMGRVQRKGLDKLLGSTTEHMLYQVPCSVLAIAL
jgi:universal stress protein E